MFGSCPQTCDAAQNAQECDGHGFDVVRPFMDDDILLEVDFVDASKGPQKIAQACPEAFRRIVVDLADAIPV